MKIPEPDVGARSKGLDHRIPEAAAVGNEDRASSTRSSRKPTVPRCMPRRLDECRWPVQRLRQAVAAERHTTSASDGGRGCVAPLSAAAAPDGPLRRRSRRRRPVIRWGGQGSRAHVGGSVAGARHVVITTCGSCRDQGRGLRRQCDQATRHETFGKKLPPIRSVDFV